MKNTKVTLVPLTADDREQFILDNQWAFKYGAMMEFGERDGHMDFDGEIISRKTIERCIDSPDSETYIKDVIERHNIGGDVVMDTLVEILASAIGSHIETFGSYPPRF